MANTVTPFRSRQRVKKPLIVLFSENPDLMREIQEVLRDAISEGLIFEDDPEIYEILNAKKLWPELLMAPTSSDDEEVGATGTTNQAIGLNVRLFDPNRKKN